MCPKAGKNHFVNKYLMASLWVSGITCACSRCGMDYRGNFGTILPQAQALASAAVLRGDLASAQLAEHQLEWIVGRNPFSESTMYGEGYDFTPLYTPSSGDMVGALPVGIQTKGENDAPYWPVQAMWTYKEVWGHPVTNWIWLLKDIEGPAIVEGRATGDVIFKEIDTKDVIKISSDKTGHFKTTVPEGEYMIISNGGEQKQTFLASTSYHLECRRGFLLSYQISKEVSAKGVVTIKLTAQGNGIHHFSIRTDNLTIAPASKTLKLKLGTSLSFEWTGRIASPDTPWVAVVVPDDDMPQRKETRGD